MSISNLTLQMFEIIIRLCFFLIIKKKLMDSNIFLCVYSVKLFNKHFFLLKKKNNNKLMTINSQWLVYFREMKSNRGYN